MPSDRALSQRAEGAVSHDQGDRVRGKNARAPAGRDSVRHLVDLYLGPREDRREPHLNHPLLTRG